MKKAKLNLNKIILVFFIMLIFNQSTIPLVMAANNTYPSQKSLRQDSNLLNHAVPEDFKAIADNNPVNFESQYLMTYALLSDQYGAGVEQNNAYNKLLDGDNHKLEDEAFLDLDLKPINYGSKEIVDALSNQKDKDKATQTRSVEKNHYLGDEELDQKLKEVAHKISQLMANSYVDSLAKLVASKNDNEALGYGHKYFQTTANIVGSENDNRAHFFDINWQGVKQEVKATTSFLGAVASDIKDSVLGKNEYRYRSINKTVASLGNASDKQIDSSLKEHLANLLTADIEKHLLSQSSLSIAELFDENAHNNYSFKKAFGFKNAANTSLNPSKIAKIMRSQQGYPEFEFLKSANGFLFHPQNNEQGYQKLKNGYLYDIGKHMESDEEAKFITKKATQFFIDPFVFNLKKLALDQKGNVILGESDGSGKVVVDKRAYQYLEGKADSLAKEIVKKSAYFKEYQQLLAKKQEKAKEFKKENIQLFSWVPLTAYFASQKDHFADVLTKNLKNYKEDRLNKVQAQEDGYSVLAKDNSLAYLTLDDIFYSKKASPLLVTDKQASFFTLNGQKIDLAKKANFSESLAFSWSNDQVKLAQQKPTNLSKSQSLFYDLTQDKNNFANQTDSILGIDNFGNLINGFNGSVVLPYWLNDNLAEFSSFANQTARYLTLMPNMDHKIPKQQAKAKEGQTSKAYRKKAQAIGINLDNYLYLVSEKVSKQIAKESLFTNAELIQLINYYLSGQKTTEVSQKVKQVLALILSINTYQEVKNWSNTYLEKAKASSSMFVSRSSALVQKDENKHAENFYSANDLIQRIGLMTDIGYMRQIQMTIASFVTNIYNNTFAKYNHTNIFYTARFGDENYNQEVINSIWKIWAAFFVLFCAYGITCVSLSLFSFTWETLFKRILLLLFIPLLLTQWNYVTGLVLNKPSQIVLSNQLKQQAVLDLWQNNKEEKISNNRLYAALFGNTNFEALNKNANYTIEFYTNQTKDGKKYAQYSETADSSAMKQYLKENPKQRLLGISDQKLRAEKLVKVKVALIDLINWAKVQWSKNFDEHGNPRNESQEANIVPLFVWLDKKASENPELIEKYGTGNVKDFEDNQTDVSYGPGGYKSSKELAKVFENPVLDASKNKQEQANIAESQNDQKVDLQDENSKVTDIDPALNQKNSELDETDNSKAYEGIAQYEEYAGYTGFNFNDAEQKAGRKNIVGQSISASRLFYLLWCMLEDNPEKRKHDDLADIDRFNQLYRFSWVLKNPAEALKRYPIDKNDYVFSSWAKKVFISDLAMTKEQRQAEFGSQHSPLVEKMAQMFQIKLPDTDYFSLQRKRNIFAKPKEQGNLKESNSLMSLLKPDPDWLKTKAMGSIFKINEKLIKNYVNNYALVRMSLAGQVKEADLAQIEDDFSKAEVQMLLIELWFQVNQELKIHLFPKNFDANSISNDTYNRMLLIPIGKYNLEKENEELKNAYEKDAMLGKSSVANYLVLRENFLSLIFLLILNIALISWSSLLFLLFVYILLPFEIINLLWNLCFPNRQKTDSKTHILAGTIIVIASAIAKLIIVLTVAYLSKKLNLDYIKTGNNSSWQVLISEISVSGLIFVILYLFISNLLLPLFKNGSAGVIYATTQFKNKLLSPFDKVYFHSKAVYLKIKRSELKTGKNKQSLTLKEMTGPSLDQKRSQHLLKQAQKAKHNFKQIYAKTSKEKSSWPK